MGYAFNIAADLGPMASNLKTWTETIAAQADEVDGAHLQYEGGLSTTSLVINGLLKYSKTLQVKSPLTDTQAQKFIAYFLSRRSVQQAKGASILMEVLETIADERKENAICMEFFDHGIIQPDNTFALVKLMDVLNRPLKKASTFHANVLSNTDGSPLASKLALKSKASDNTVHELDLTPLKLTRGTYNIELTYNSMKKVLPIKMLGKVLVQNVEIGIGESDSAAADQQHPLEYPNKLPSITSFSFDHKQKISMKATLVDELTAQPITVHQSFVLFRDAESKKEIIFIAEQDSSKAYKFNLDVGAHAGFFGHSSGFYSCELIVGDALVSNSFRWHLADVELKFQQRFGFPTGNFSFFISICKAFFGLLPQLGVFEAGRSF